jgi:hypothetical protein
MSIVIPDLKFYCEVILEDGDHGGMDEFAKIKIDENCET